MGKGESFDLKIDLAPEAQGADAGIIAPRFWRAEATGSGDGSFRLTPPEQSAVREVEARATAGK
ncbi:MAG: hypothetical protein R3F11_09660 [Verrucomicrobiales bacterium]